VYDQTEEGASFRILTLIDEYTRECLATHAARSIRAVDVITVLEMAIARHGAPKVLRSDNGPEFIAKAQTLVLMCPPTGVRSGAYRGWSK